MVDARDAADEVGLVLGLDQHRGVRREVDLLALGDCELHLAHLGLAAVRVGELVAARRAALVVGGTPQGAAALAAPVLLGGDEVGALGGGAPTLGLLEAVDELQRRVELGGLGRGRARRPPVEQAAGVADHAVGRGHDRRARGDRQHLAAVGVVHRRPHRHHPQREVVGVVVGRLLGDAFQGQVGQGDAQLGRLLVAERHGEVTHLADPLGEEVARIGVLRISVRERGEHHHGVTAVGHDEMETVESEVRGYQSDGQTSDAGGVQSPASCIRFGMDSGVSASSRHCSDGVAATLAAQRFPKAPACPDYSAVNCTCNTRSVDSRATVSVEPVPPPSPPRRLRTTAPGWRSGRGAGAGAPRG